MDTPTEFRQIQDLSNLNARLRQLLAYWEGKAGKDRIPGRRDIDPIDIPWLMPDIAFADVLRDPLDYRYRLVGTHLVEMMGGERTGRRMRELFTPEAVAGAVAILEHLLSSRRPIGFEGQMYWLGKGHRPFQALLLPLAADGSTVDMAIMGMHFVA